MYTLQTLQREVETLETIKTNFEKLMISKFHNVEIDIDVKIEWYKQLISCGEYCKPKGK